MAKDRQNIFWIKTGETFAGREVGSDITDFFYDENDKPTQPERLKKLKKAGYVSMEEPISIEQASEKELNQLRETVKEQVEKIADLENDLAKVPKNVTAARKQIKELKAVIIEKEIEIDKLTAARKEIKALKAEIVEKDIELDKLTAPGGGKKS